MSEMIEIHPKLPMRNPAETKSYYREIGFDEIADYGDYLIMRRGQIEIHFFQFTELNPLENYGQVYIRASDVEKLYEDFLGGGIVIHPNGPLQKKPWGQTEFSLLDPDNNLLTFGGV